MATKQKAIQLKIENTNDKEAKEKLKRERRKISRTIKKENLKYVKALLNSRISEVEDLKDGAQMYAAIRLLRRRQQKTKLVVHDEHGKTIGNPIEMVNTIADHFEILFNGRADALDEGEERYLNNKITHLEVLKAIKKLKNNRAAGPDNINGELIKYSPMEISTIITNLLNEMFHGNTIPPIGKGTLIPLQKPNKPQGPLNNIRPIILLNTIRKIFRS
ncbi:uncharacterized protein LOC115230839 [Octopus sinensis]|uniref:Uncharacterized protein LOC115230839 n=1 Tax=Octopus sinensis TaxID=2607531 RepID=A0A6P7TWP0_9MOLL|nr:uncharacterized protein LOC115230839 [Octopus sinensis]